jgi:hypothetical protein
LNEEDKVCGNIDETWIPEDDEYENIDECSVSIKDNPLDVALEPISADGPLAEPNDAQELLDLAREHNIPAAALWDHLVHAGAAKPGRDGCKNWFSVGAEAVAKLVEILRDPITGAILAGALNRPSEPKKKTPRKEKPSPGDWPPGWSEEAERRLQQIRSDAPKTRTKDGEEVRLTHGTSKELRDLWTGIMRANPDVTPRELRACYIVYCRDQGEDLNFTQLLSTFYGNQKSTWADWLEPARAALREIEAAKLAPSEVAP